MKTPPKMTKAARAEACEQFIPGTKCCVGLLGRAGTWSRGPACGDATVQARQGTAHDHGAPLSRSAVASIGQGRRNLLRAARDLAADLRPFAARLSFLSRARLAAARDTGADFA